MSHLSTHQALGYLAAGGDCGGGGGGGGGGKAEAEENSAQKLKGKKAKVTRIQN